MPLHLFAEEDTEQGLYGGRIGEGRVGGGPAGAYMRLVAVTVLALTIWGVCPWLETIVLKGAQKSVAAPRGARRGGWVAIGDVPVRVQILAAVFLG